jgi:hypothetical protein
VLKVWSPGWPYWEVLWTFKRWGLMGSSWSTGGSSLEGDWGTQAHILPLSGEEASGFLHYMLPVIASSSNKWDCLLVD